MNFHGYEKQSFGYANICKDSKRNQNEPKRSNAANNQQQRFTTIFPYHVHKQADFEISFINGRGFIYLGISKMSFTF